MLDVIRRFVGEAVSEAVAARHHLHRNPELSEREEKTAAFVAERLREVGVDDLRTGVGGHGVLATLRGKKPGRTFALRADMDALPIEETAEHPYKSCVQGVMHACGHDGHTATLLGTAAVLARLREEFAGEVRLIFQPAEETVDGAAKMCREGAMKGVDAIVALHGWPGMDVGRVGVRQGPIMASSDTFELTIKGRGAHAAQPHNGVDPIVVGAQVVLALQTLSSREINPTDPVVVTVAQFNAGTAHNIIPGFAELRGTVRCLTSQMREEMPQRIERIVSGVCAALRAEYRFHYRYGTPVTINDESIIQLVTVAATEAFGPESVETLDAPSMGAEDFAFYLEHAPGAMFRLGVGLDITPLHTPTYNFADDALPIGIEVFTRTSLNFLRGDIIPVA